MVKSVNNQAASGRSTVREVFPDATKAENTFFESYSRFGESGNEARKYVKYSYETASCKLDIDGGCARKPERRRHIAIVTVGLETQARTQQELQAMEAGEMEMRQIDVLWVCAASAPVAKWGEAEETIVRALESFSVPIDIANG